MNVSVTTTSDKSSSEIPTLIKLFKAGLPTLHLRKSKFTSKKLKEYLDFIPKEYHNRIIIHSHHHLIFSYNLKGIHFTRIHLKKKFKSYLKMKWYKLRKRNLVITRSFHHLESLSSNKIKYSYVFLNPFFSKTEPKKNHFDITPAYMTKILAEYHTPIHASGNIIPENVGLLKDYNLHGVSLSKIIWDNPGSAVEIYESICKDLA